MNKDTLTSFLKTLFICNDMFVSGFLLPVNFKLFLHFLNISFQRIYIIWNNDSSISRIWMIDIENYWSIKHILKVSF